MDVSGELHVRDRTLVLTEHDAGWTPDPVWTIWRRKLSLFPYWTSNPGLSRHKPRYSFSHSKKVPAVYFSFRTCSLALIEKWRGRRDWQRRWGKSRTFWSVGLNCRNDFEDAGVNTNSVKTDIKTSGVEWIHLAQYNDARSMELVPEHYAK